MPGKRGKTGQGRHSNKAIGQKKKHDSKPTTAASDLIVSIEEADEMVSLQSTIICKTPISIGVTPQLASASVRE